MIEKKAKQLKKVAVVVAAGAATTAGFPILLTCETPIMQRFLQSVLVSFGLDDKSIQRLAKRVNKPEAELKSLMKSSGVNKSTVESMIYSRARVTRLFRLY